MHKRSLLGAAVLLSAGLACTGKISGPGGGVVSGGPTPADKMNQATNPDLFAVASKYFPSTDATAPPKRMVRLTRAPSSHASSDNQHEHGYAALAVSKLVSTRSHGDSRCCGSRGSRRSC